MNGAREADASDYDFDNQMNKMWQNGVEQDRADEGSLKFDSDGLPILDPYQFGKYSTPLLLLITTACRNRQ